jgi:hypothetical protein
VIYEFPEADVPIRQGDIFIGVPRIEVSLRRIPVVGADGQQSVSTWNEIAQAGEPVTALLAIQPVAAIVATQDCDTLHAPDVTLCEIGKFKEVERKAGQTVSAKSWKNILTQHARINQKWFYLPPDGRIGFTEKMAVNFMVALRVPGDELEELRSLRRGRLNNLADEHFRERIAEFFRRYPMVSIERGRIRRVQKGVP